MSKEGLQIAEMVCKAQLFGVKSKEDAFVRMATGIGLGLTAMQALRAIHVINGKPGLGADLMIGLCRQSPDCEYFRCSQTDENGATFIAKRRSDSEPTTLSFTRKDAQNAELLSNAMYKKYPAAMFRARAGSALARLMFPEKMHGLYTPDELNEGQGIDESSIGIEGVEPMTSSPAPLRVVATRAPETIRESEEPKNHGPDLDKVAADFDARLRSAKTKAEIKAIGATIPASGLDETRRARLRVVAKARSTELDAPPPPKPEPVEEQDMTDAEFDESPVSS